MELTESKNIDTEAWNKLVLDSGGSIFSLSGYIGAVADNWAVLYNDDKSGGMICPYSKKLGIKILYTPFFHRYTEWIGENPPEPKMLIAELKKYFRVADAQVHWKKKLLFRKRHHQAISKESLKKNQQVKRMLKKAQRFEVTEDLDRDRLLELLKTELSPRIDGINAHSLSLLKKLAGNFSFPELVQLNLTENGTWRGAVWLLPFNDRIIYLKGTVEAEAKENGGMYRLIDEAMQLAFSNGAVFDFGGSNAKGVRRFNLNWGSEDVFYYNLHWNNAPLWWKLIKSMRSAWKKR